MSLGDPPSDYHDVSGNFAMVNLWGFINFMVAIGIGCCAGCCSIVSNECSGIIGGIGGFLTGLSYISHFITLLVMRWRHAGRVCSGDYEDGLHFYSPLGEEKEPYLHLTGSWLFYSGATQIYLVCMIISSISFVAGSDH